MRSTRKPTQNLNVKPSRVLSTLLLVALLVLAAAPRAEAGKPPSGVTIATNPFAEQAGAKLLVDQDGWYSISRQSVIAAGWDPGTSAAYLQLWADGVQQAILVNAGANGSFDPVDTIEFYGRATDTPWTGARVYWLVNGSSQGLRITQLGTTRGTTGAASFNDTSVFAPKTVYAPAVALGSPDGFYGDIVTSSPVSEPINAPDVVASPGTTNVLEVSLRGLTFYSHRVTVQLNGNLAGTMACFGQESMVASLSVPSEWVLSGTNAVTLTSLDGVYDRSLVVSIKLTYPRSFSAVDGVLDMTAPGGSTITVNRFSSPSVRAFDVSSPASPQQFATTVTSAAGSYAASFTTPRSKANLTVLAVAADRILSPQIVANTPSSLASTTNQADLVILAHSSMAPTAAPLASLRQQQGMQVMTIDVDDVYDTFSFGSKDPQALKSFLQYTLSKWSRAPRYVMLLGGASFDSRNYLGHGELDFVPTKYVPTDKTLTASDDWLVDFDNDGLPNLAIGRIPARDAQEAATVISKIVSYGQQTGTWTSNILMVADKNDAGNVFESALASVAALVPSGYTAQTVLNGQVGAPATATAIVNGINAGQLIVNYQGHGFPQAWAAPGVLTVGTVPGLTNLDQLPFVVSMSCLTGSFHDPTTVSLAAALLTASNGGAVAFWGSSGLTNLGGETLINQQLYRLLLSGSRPALGDAVAQAKAATTDQDVRKTWIFFGDPSMKLAQ